MRTYHLGGRIGQVNAAGHGDLLRAAAPARAAGSTCQVQESSQVQLGHTGTVILHADIPSPGLLKRLPK